MKVGDKVTCEDTDGVYVIKQIDEALGRVTATSLYTGKEERLRLSALKKTVKTPVVLVSTYGAEWRDIVYTVLTKNKIRFKTVPGDRNRDLTKFWVDAKKLSVAKNILDKHYEDEKNGIVVLKNTTHFDNDIDEELTF